MRWLLVSTPDDVRLVKQDRFCHRCFERKARTTILLDETLADGDERCAWIRLAREKSVKMYGTVSCDCFRRSKIPGTL